MEVASTSLQFRIAYPHIFRHPQPARSRAALEPLRGLEELTEQDVKVVDAVFPLHRIAPAVIGGRLQPPLNRFANVNVFLLDGLAETDGLPYPLPRLFRM